MLWLAARHKEGHLLIGRSAGWFVVLLLGLLALRVGKKKKVAA